MPQAFRAGELVEGPPSTGGGGGGGGGGKLNPKAQTLSQKLSVGSQRATPRTAKNIHTFEQRTTCLESVVYIERKEINLRYLVEVGFVKLNVGTSLPHLPPTKPLHTTPPPPPLLQ